MAANSTSDLSLEEIGDIILDMKEGIKGIGGEDSYIEFLQLFPDMAIKPELEKMKTAIENDDMKELRERSHSLKGSSSIIYALQVKNISEKMQYAFDHGEPEKMKLYYPILIKHVILLKREIKKVLSQKQGILYMNSKQDDEDISLARNYTLIINDDDIIVKLENNIFKPTEVIVESKSPKGSIKQKNEESKKIVEPKQDKEKKYIPDVNQDENTNKSPTPKNKNNKKKNPGCACCIIF